MRTITYYITIFLILVVSKTHAQGFFKSEFMPTSDFQDYKNNKLGTGNLLKFTGMYNIPLSMKKNEAGQATSWMVSLYGSYAKLQNTSIGDPINPSEILNASANVTYIRPISKRWSLVSSIGAGIYSSPHEITSKSILANGGAIFVYKANKNLDLGIGAGVTNAFGPPLLMPMTLVKWTPSIGYEVDVNLSGTGLKLSAANKFNDYFKLRLVALEFEGMASVIQKDGKDKIYGTSYMKSFLSPELKLGKKSTLYLGVGATWLRSVTFTDRSFKGFLNNFKDESQMNFKVTGYGTIGFRYGF